MALSPAITSYPLASLYVGDLHPDVTETMLHEKFSVAGPLLSLHVCRDVVNKKSLGYAYINFHQPADAERALDSMNYDLLKSRPIRIMWSQRDPSLRKSGVGNVFIKNLDKGIDNKAMYDTFSAFGVILSCKVAQDEVGVSKGYGFVHFETEDAANRAIEKVNGMLLNNKKVYVGKFIPRVEREKQLGKRAKMFTNCFIKNFGERLNDESLRELFAEFGAITSYKVMCDEKGVSKGFGFVAYDDGTAAESAVTKMNGFRLEDGGALYVGRAQKKAERQLELRRRYEQMKVERYNNCRTSNLFIKNLDESIDDDRLRKEFEPFGVVTSAKVMTESDRSKGFGFVCFATSNEAAKALAEMNGKLLLGKPLYVALAQRKDDRKAYLTAQYMQRLASVRAQQFSYPNGACFLQPSSQLRYYPQLPNATMGGAGGNGVGGRGVGVGVGMGVGPRWPIPTQIRATPSSNGAFSALHRVGSRIGGGARPALPMAAARPITNHHQQQQQQQQQQQNHRQQQQQQQQQQQLKNRLPELLAPPSEHKQMLGERLFPMIHHVYPDYAAKITGMLLEIGTPEIVRMLENEDSLKTKVEEAMAMLQAHHGHQAIESKE